VTFACPRPFLTRLSYRGGELFKHLSEQRRFSEERAKFYAA
jgi:serine/threonine protein kinase